MSKQPWSLISLGVVILTATVSADEGKWSPDQISHSPMGESLLKHRREIALMSQDPRLTPQAVLQDFQTKLNALTTNSIQVTIGTSGLGSASFISEYGLVATNDHVVDGCLDDYADLRAAGFLVDSTVSFDQKQLIDSLPCENDTGFRMAVFKRRIDITGGKAIPEDVQAECEENTARAQARRAHMLEKAPKITLAPVGRSVCVTTVMNNGSTYYDVFDVYFDFRLVFLAPSTLAAFAIDAQNFNWNERRGHLDAALGRLYDENDEPVRVAQPLRVNPAKLQEGQFVMSFGYPGRTHRFLSLAEYDALAEMLAFDGMQAHYNYQQNLKTAVNNGSYADDEVKTKIKGEQNVAVGTRYKGEQMPVYREDKVDEEKAIRAFLQAEIKKGNDAARQQLQAYDDMTNYQDATHSVAMAEKIHLFFQQSNMVKFAERLLSRFSDDSVSTLNNSDLVKSAAALDMQSERELLVNAYSWALKVFARGPAFGLPEFNANQWPTNAFQGDSIFDQTDAEELSQALRGFLSTKVSSQDLDHYPFIKMVSLLQQHRQALTKPTATLSLGMQATQNLILQAQLAYRGQSTKPCIGGNCAQDPLHQRFMTAADASASMRLTFGNIMKYQKEDNVVDCFSSARALCADYENAVKRHAKEGSAFYDFADYDLDPEVLRCLQQCQSHLNFISNLDTTGGASGSPTLNGAGEFIGLVFDGNREGMAADYVTGARQQQTNRAVHVSAEYLFEFIKLAFPNQAKVLFEELHLPNK